MPDPPRRSAQRVMRAILSARSQSACASATVGNSVGRTNAATQDPLEPVVVPALVPRCSHRKEIGAVEFGAGASDESIATCIDRNLRASRQYCQLKVPRLAERLIDEELLLAATSRRRYGELLRSSVPLSAAARPKRRFAESSTEPMGTFGPPVGLMRRASSGVGQGVHRLIL